MRYLIFAILLLPMAGVAFAQDMDVCEAQEDVCQETCCTGIGGTFSIEDGSYLCNNDPAFNTQYDQCTMQCNGQVVDCMAPGGGCGQGYKSCASACMSQGNRLEYCDDQCMDSTVSCISESTGGGPGCCGPSFLLGLLLLGAFVRRHR